MYLSDFNEHDSETTGSERAQQERKILTAVGGCCYHTAIPVFEKGGMKCGEYFKNKKKSEFFEKLLDYTKILF